MQFADFDLRLNWHVPFFTAFIKKLTFFCKSFVLQQKKTIIIEIQLLEEFFLACNFRNFMEVNISFLLFFYIWWNIHFRKLSYDIAISRYVQP